MLSTCTTENNRRRGPLPLAANRIYDSLFPSVQILLEIGRIKVQDGRIDIVYKILAMKSRQLEQSVNE